MIYFLVNDILNKTNRRGKVDFKLTPSILEKDQISVYAAFFDKIYKDEVIKNIAITGKYGAGKSSVWNSYKKHRLDDWSSKSIPDPEFNKDNIITVSLPCFSNHKTEGNDAIGKNQDELTKFKDSKRTLEQDSSFKKEVNLNNIEQQIINQILYQIDQQKIPLTKYKLKNPKNKEEMKWSKFLVSVFIVGFFLLSFNQQIGTLLFSGCDSAELIISIVGGTLISFVVGFLVIKALPFINIRILKISVNGTEAIVDEDDSSNILNQEIKELVYLIKASNIRTIVFEDIDRYDSVELFTRLRELNYLVNAKNNAVVRFIYIMKDDLFDNNNRTKFFDIIIPIVPFLNKQNSASVMKDVFSSLDIDIKPKDDFLEDIAYYIDDMRTLKSIRNEFEIYASFIQANSRKLNNEQLCSLIILKNLHPSEFELLQNHAGVIVTIFGLLESDRKRLQKTLSDEIVSIENEILELKSQSLDRLSSSLISKIPSYISIQNNSMNWHDLITHWYKNQDEQYSIRSNKPGMVILDFSGFIALLNPHLTMKISPNFLSDDIISKEIKDKREKIEVLLSDISNISTLKISKILSFKSNETLDLFFEQASSDFELKKEFISIVRYMLMNSYLDETFAYYLGNLTQNKDKMNDEIFIRCLRDGTINDEELKLDFPNEVIKRMTERDYERVGIYNKSLLYEFITGDYNSEPYWKIIKSTLKSSKRESIVTFLNSMEMYHIQSFVTYLAKNSFETLWDVIIVSSRLNTLSYKISYFLYSDTKLIIDHKKELNDFVSNDSKILGQQFSASEQFLNGLSKFGVEFNDISSIEKSIEFARKIEELGLFRISPENILKISNLLIEDNDEFNNSFMLNNLINNEVFKVTRDRVKIDLFLEEYLNYVEQREISVLTDEQVFIDLLNNSLLPESLLKKLIRFSKVKIQSIKSINNQILWDDLLEYKNITFNLENTSDYYDVFNVTDVLISYINDQFCTLKSSVSSHLADELIKYDSINNDIYESVLLRSTKNVDSIEMDLSNQKILLLVKNRKINLTLQTFNYLTDKVEIDLVGKFIKNHSDSFLSFINTHSLYNSLSYELITYISNKKILTRNALTEILNLCNKKISQFDILDADKVVRKHALANCFDINDIKYFIDNKKDFDLWSEFQDLIINRIDYYEESLKYVWNKTYINRFMNSKVSSDFKVKLISDTIVKKNSLSIVPGLITKIEELNTLSEIFKGKKPIIITPMEIKIAEAFESINVVSISIMKNGKRIHFRKSKFNELVSKNEKI